MPLPSSAFQSAYHAEPPIGTPVINDSDWDRYRRTASCRKSNKNVRDDPAVSQALVPYRDPSRVAPMHITPDATMHLNTGNMHNPMTYVTHVMNGMERVTQSLAALHDTINGDTSQSTVAVAHPSSMPTLPPPALPPPAL